MESYFEETSKKIKAGNQYTLYVIHCIACKKYKRILASAPCGPGGTLSCPVCIAKKQNGPHLEGAYGTVKSNYFKIVLPKEVDLD